MLDLRFYDCNMKLDPTRRRVARQPLDVYTLTPANFGAKEDVCRRVGQSLRSTRTIVVLGVGGACGLEVERHPDRLWFVSKTRIYAWLMDVR